MEKEIKSIDVGSIIAYDIMNSIKQQNIVLNSVRYERKIKENE
jgi:hypothetical protein